MSAEVEESCQNPRVRPTAMDSRVESRVETFKSRVEASASRAPNSAPTYRRTRQPAGALALARRAVVHGPAIRKSFLRGRLGIEPLTITSVASLLPLLGRTKTALGRAIAGQGKVQFGDSRPPECSSEVFAMLRITANDNPRALTFRLEGRLEGPWVRELEQCWRGLLDESKRPIVCVDLTGLTYIDAAGKARLTEMHEEGARFIAGDCVTKALVAEIVGK